MPVLRVGACTLDTSDGTLASSWRRAAASACYRRALAMSPQFVPASLRLAHLASLAGRRADAERLLSAVESRTRAAIASGDETPTSLWWLAAAAAIRGDRAEASARFEQSVRAGRRDALWDSWDPLLSSLRSDPAFVPLQSAFAAEHRAAMPVADRVRRALAHVERDRSGS